MFDLRIRCRESLPTLAAIAFVFLSSNRGICQIEMTAREFNELTDTDKRTVLVRTLEERERAVKNLRASSVTHVYNVEYRDGKTGAVVDDMSRYVCELRRKDGNHWASIDWFLTKNPDRPNQKVITSKNIKDGLAKSVAEQDTLKGVYGAIATEEDLMIRTGRFHYWFDASFDKPREFPISFLLKHKDTIQFQGLEEGDQLIKISLDIQTRNGTPFQESRTLWLDPQKGLMPLKMHWRWEYETVPPLYSEIETEIKELVQVQGVWLPVHFVETVIGRVSVADGYATVYETTASGIELGTMTDEDLDIRFPDGTEVEDRIKGAWFVAGQSVQSAPSPAPKTSRMASRWIVIANLVVLTVVAVAAWMSKRRRKLKDAAV